MDERFSWFLCKEVPYAPDVAKLCIAQSAHGIDLLFSLEWSQIEHQDYGHCRRYYNPTSVYRNRFCSSGLVL